MTKRKVKFYKDMAGKLQPTGFEKFLMKISSSGIKSHSRLLAILTHRWLKTLASGMAKTAISKLLSECIVASKLEEIATFTFDGNTFLVYTEEDLQVVWDSPLLDSLSKNQKLFHAEFVSHVSNILGGYTTTKSLNTNTTSYMWQVIISFV